MKIELYLPIKTVSEANCSQHWAIKSKRHQQQKQLVSLLLSKHKFSPPCTFTLTRLAPKLLDKHDNLPMSMKYIVDALAELATGNYTPGQADSDDRIVIEYGQEVSKRYGIKLCIEME